MDLVPVELFFGGSPEAFLSETGFTESVRSPQGEGN
jgi:hypothetical protein